LNFLLRKTVASLNFKPEICTVHISPDLMNKITYLKLAQQVFACVYAVLDQLGLDATKMFKDCLI
jgi:hypothetical protein